MVLGIDEKYETLSIYRETEKEMNKGARERSRKTVDRKKERYKRTNRDKKRNIQRKGNQERQNKKGIK